MRLTIGLILAAALSAHEVVLTNLSGLEMKNAVAQLTTYHGSPALKLTEKAPDGGESMALVRNLVFRNGTIDLEVAGSPAKSATAGARGFIGVAFHAQQDPQHFECFYLRPTNGRADDQLRRNHSTQYASFPDWPWERLRKETPGMYESYVDLQPGEWTKVRIVVHDRDASLFVGGAPLNHAQPCLLVHDLKLGATEGAIALWIGPGTEGYFRNLHVTANTAPPPPTPTR